MTEPGAGPASRCTSTPDNIVTPRYDQVNGRSSFQRDKAKGLESLRLAAARWTWARSWTTSSPPAPSCRPGPTRPGFAGVNASTASSCGLAVDLVQLFSAVAYGKNGADIRLAVDAVEDMFWPPDLTHVVIVAGDSDYIPLACSAANDWADMSWGSGGRVLEPGTGAARDDFVIYDSLPGVLARRRPPPTPRNPPGSPGGARLQSPRPRIRRSPRRLCSPAHRRSAWRRTTPSDPRLAAPPDSFSGSHSATCRCFSPGRLALGRYTPTAQRNAA